MKIPFWAKKNPKRWEQLSFNTKTLIKIEEEYGELHCEYCGKEGLRVYQWYEKLNDDDGATADHFYPKSKHPEYALNEENIVVACIKCNGDKANKRPNTDDIKYPRCTTHVANLKSLII